MEFETFNKIKSLDDLAFLLNVAPNKLNNILEKIGYNVAYIPREIEKRGGGFRKLNIPSRELRTIQEKILRKILEKISMPECLHGGRKGKSIITNASQHLKQKFILKIDVKDFFPSIRFEKIGKIFLDLGFNRGISNYLRFLTTMDYCLPQGAPTSPLLSNLAFLHIDKDLYNLSRKCRLKYTRYFDDIAISGNRIPDSLEKKFYKIIEIKGFKINYKKSKKYSKKEKPIITGLMIDGKIALPEEQIQEDRKSVV